MKHDKIEQGHPIVAVLVERGITQVALAAAIDFDAAHLNRVFRKHRPASRKVRRACAAYLGLPEAALFRDENGRKAA